MSASRITLVAFTFSMACSSVSTIPSTSSAIAACDNVDVHEVLNTLKVNTDTILPQIRLVPSSISSATMALSALQSRGTFVKRQSVNDLAALTAGIIKDINTTSNGIENKGYLRKLGLIQVISVSLSKLLFTLDIVASGLLQLVAVLLTGVIGTLVVLLLGLLGVLV
ncbi:hypothetical protein DFS33DRAFT_1455712 [Desarmillaria ectypa]|nr:hypothetical protein DFS33DRAFT_1455712 [Desarmillaria ectypa]